MNIKEILTLVTLPIWFPVCLILSINEDMKSDNKSKKNI